MRVNVLNQAMTCMIFACFWVTNTANGTLPLTGTFDDRQLSRQIKTTLDKEVFPAMKAGNDAYFYQSLGPILSKAPYARVQAIEEYAQTQGVESPVSHFVDLKLMRLEQGVDSPDAKMKLNEAMLLIDGINKRLKNFVDSVDSHPFMQDTVVVSRKWMEARNQFWEAHVIRNEFENVSRMLKFGTSVLSPLKSIIDKEARALELVNTFTSFVNEFAEKYDELEQRTIEARLIRFRRSTKAIEGDGAFEEKFTAGMSLQIDVDAIIPYLTNKTELSREALKKPGLISEVQSEYANAMVVDPELVEKAWLLRTGLHWWLRGRYGLGVSYGGLMKSESSVTKLSVKSRKRGPAFERWVPDMGAQNALYMPRVRPKPEFSGANDRSEQKPYFERRHYYTWAIEYRPLFVNGASSRKSGNRDIVHTKVLNRQRFNQDFFW